MSYNSLVSTDPGLGAEPTLNNFSSPSTSAAAPLGWENKDISWHSRPWARPNAKGGPCSVAGACNHGEFEARSDEEWREHFLERYAWNSSDPNKPIGARELEEDSSGLSPQAKPVVTDDALLSHPIGETIVSSPEFKIDSVLSTLRTVCLSNSFCTF